VQWQDTPNGESLTVNFEQSTATSGGGITWSHASTQTLTARIRSVAGQNGPSGTLNLPFCSTSPFTLNVPTEYFVNVPNESITAYLWEVPATWGVQGASQIPSFGSTPVNFKLYEGTRTITLTPTPGGNVDLRVFQYSSVCNQTYSPSQLYKLLSFPGAYRIQRQPTVTITAGPTTLYCGDRTPQTYAAQASSGASSFTWTYPSGWTVQGPATNASIVLIPDGNSGSESISVQAFYTCGGPTTLAVAASEPRAVTVRPEVAPVVLAPIPASCPGQTIRVSVGPAPGVTTYAWTVPYPFSPQGVTTTTVPYLDISSNATALNRAFSVRVKGGSSNSSCTPSVDEKTGILGTGSGIAVVTDAPKNETEICPYTNITLQAVILDNQFSASTAYGYTWTISKRNGQTGALTTTTEYAQTVTATTPAVGDWLDVGLRVTSSCGDFFPTSNSWQSVSHFQNGQLCLDAPTAPTPKEQLTETAYPNPANNRLQLPPAAGTYILYNGHGRPVRQQRVIANAAAVFNTEKLPDGLYYLVHQDEEGRFVRQTIQLQH